MANALFSPANRPEYCRLFDLNTSSLPSVQSDAARVFAPARCPAIVVEPPPSPPKDCAPTAPALVPGPGVKNCRSMPEQSIAPPALYPRTEKPLLLAPEQWGGLKTAPLARR